MVVSCTDFVTTFADEAFHVLEGDVAFRADGRDITATARMLIVVSPSGQERSFAEVGQEVTNRTAAPQPVTPADS